MSVTVIEKFKALQRMPSGIGLEYPVELKFDIRDPYAVSLTFCPPAQDPVTWQFSRELLLRGCYETEAYGEGDITFHTCEPGQIIHMELRFRHPARGYAEAHLPYENVERFLAKVAEVAPFDQVAVDSNELDRLLSDILGGSNE